MVAGGAVLWLLEHKGNAEHYGGHSRKAFGRSLFWSLIVLSGRDLPQSIGWHTDSPTTFAARLFGIIWMTVGVMLLSLFTATAASVLTSKQLQGLVNDPQDLRHVKVGTVANSVGQYYLDHQHIKYTPYSPGPVDVLQALSEHRIDAAVYNGPILSYYARTKFANKIVVLRFSLRQDFMAIPLPPGSPLRKPINRALLKVLDTKKWQTTLANYLGTD
jgi:ABC-type amino acid transport substrate-binding protein